jgi:endonuclease G
VWSRFTEAPEFVKDVTFQGKTTAYVNFGSQVQAVLDEVRARNPLVHSEIQRYQT